MSAYRAPVPFGATVTRRRPSPRPLARSRAARSTPAGTGSPNSSARLDRSRARGASSSTSRPSRMSSVSNTPCRGAGRLVCSLMGLRAVTSDLACLVRRDGVRDTVQRFAAGLSKGELLVLVKRLDDIADVEFERRLALEELGAGSLPALAEFN